MQPPSPLCNIGKVQLHRTTPSRHHISNLQRHISISAKHTRRAHIKLRESSSVLAGYRTADVIGVLVTEHNSARIRIGWISEVDIGVVRVGSVNESPNDGHIGVGCCCSPVAAEVVEGEDGGGDGGVGGEKQMIVVYVAVGS